MTCPGVQAAVSSNVSSGGAARGAARGEFCFVPSFSVVFFFFPLGLMSTSGSLSLSVFSSLLPLEANG